MKLLSFALPAGLALVAAPLAAQQQAADVDAVATLLPPAPSLTVSVENDLRFGQVRIPNFSRGMESVRCIYQVNLDAGFTGVRRQVITAVSETPAAGTGAVSPSGCEFADSMQDAGLATIACIPGFDVDLTASWLLGPQSNVFFRRGEAVTFGAFEAGSSNQVVFNGGGLIPEGVNFNMICPESGAVDLVLGGWLEVGVDADQTGAVSVGRIFLAVTY